MHFSRFLGFMLALLALGMIANSSSASVITTTVLEFEDIFGPCPDVGGVTGPGNVTIQGVHFETPDIATHNTGKGSNNPVEYHTPFDSDWFGFFTYGAGATVTFPAPIQYLSFQTGDNGNVQTHGTFRLLLDGNVMREFTILDTPTPDITLFSESPFTSIQFKFVSGASSLLGIDKLTFSNVPEPSVAFLTLLAIGIARQRRQ